MELVQNHYSLTEEPSPTLEHDEAPASYKMQARERWSAERAQRWYAQQPLLVGANYIPSDAGNQLEMWDEATYNPELIDKELGWMQQTCGMNVARVFLHDLVWQQDPEGMKKRMDNLLSIADAHDIKISFVIFDSCWRNDAQLGNQDHCHQPGVHNSMWQQSPNAATLRDMDRQEYLQDYVTDIVTTFGHDKRVLYWDVYNEPDNLNDGSYDESEEKLAHVESLLSRTFAWARAANPDQPLTSGVWRPDRDPEPIPSMQLRESDITSFHNYERPEGLRNRINDLAQLGRPMVCTEYMARELGSTFHGSLPVMAEYKVGSMCWGFIDGRSQTTYPWGTHRKPLCAPPEVCFHDVLRRDGTPINGDEVDYIKSFTSEKIRMLGSNDVRSAPQAALRL